MMLKKYGVSLLCRRGAHYVKCIKMYILCMLPAFEISSGFCFLFPLLMNAVERRRLGINGNCCGGVSCYFLWSNL